MENSEIRTVIKDQRLAWMEVLSGIPQRSVLALVMFVMYINDMPGEITSYISLLADDTKLLRKTEKEEDCTAFQHDLKKNWEWSQKCQVDFNAKKCNVIE